MLYAGILIIEPCLSNPIPTLADLAGMRKSRILLNKRLLQYKPALAKLLM
jgi:hypothetical protein